MRVLFEFDINWRVTITCSLSEGPTASREQIALRELCKVSDGGGGFFPFAPEGEQVGSTEPSIGEKSVGFLTSKDIHLVREIFDRISKRSPQPKDVDLFGCYLFDTLIGSRVWGKIRQIALAKSPPYIELALLWPADENSLHRLNWEMMKAPEGFLAICRKFEIAVTRIVKGALHRAHAIALPPRLLFVIGTRLYDPDIRAGAETVALLRELKHKGRSIQSRTLQLANPVNLKRMMEAFRPDAVYLVSHGGLDAQGRGYITLRKDDDHPNEDVPRYANQLLSYLNFCGQYPPIVVLSACYSAGTPNRKLLGAHHAAPLAAELVAGGIPIVVGMAGRISDAACRLFTKRFGEALISGEPLIAATAEGRRAAFGEGEPPDTSVDWAFPAVYVAEGVTQDYTPARIGADDAAVRVEILVKSYGIERQPVFCAREEFIEAYHEMLAQLLDPRGQSVVGAYVDEAASGIGGIGRTRLLEEIAVQSIRDGHVPCLVSSSSPNWRIPTTVPQLSAEILKSVAKARKIYGLQPPADSLLLKELLVEQPNSDYKQLSLSYVDQPALRFAKLVDRLERLGSNTGLEIVKVALQEDLTALVRDVRVKYKADLRAALIHEMSEIGAKDNAELKEALTSFVKQLRIKDTVILSDSLIEFIKDSLAKGDGGLQNDLIEFVKEDLLKKVASTTQRVLLLFDEVDRYGVTLTEKLLYEMLGPHGLGTETEPVPVMFVFSMSKPAFEILRPIKESPPRWLRLLPLEPFRDDGEDLLSYERVWLNPFSELKNAWVLNESAPENELNEWLKYLCRNVGGLPANLDSSIFFLITESGSIPGYLRKADDEDILAASRRNRIVPTGGLR
jgi:hypothetical protein